MWTDEQKKRILWNLFNVLLCCSGGFIVSMIFISFETGNIVIPLSICITYLGILIISGIEYCVIRDRIFINHAMERERANANVNINNFNINSNVAFSSSDITRMEKEMSKLIKDETNRD